MADKALKAFILGGQRSGKSRRAEDAAIQWLSVAPGHQAMFIATAQAWDDEMSQRIARHKSDRALRMPGLSTIEEPRHVASTITQHSRPDVLLVVDCLTLWLTHLTLPLDAADAIDEPGVVSATEALCLAIAEAPGPVVLVGNEIGLGVIPLGSEVRQFVDALGRLNQRVAAVCDSVTLMVAGLPLTLKGDA